MRIVLLSGGSGKRLWPLSNDSRSKQFLKVLEGNSGGHESMIQRTWSQLKAAGLAESVIIATNKSQVNIIQSQLGESVEMVVEPARRDTYPAIALAAAYLASVKQASLSEVVAVVPVDSYVADHFFNLLKKLEEILRATEAELALLAVQPSYPSERHGYIVPESKQEGNDCIKVSYFKEKPTREQAIELITRQSLWNCGIFAFKLSYVLSKLEEKGLPADYLKLRKGFAALPEISFDYEIVEKAKDVIALPYEGEWKDLGTWNTLTEEIRTPIIGNGILSESCQGSHLINELDVPVVVAGLSNIVVAASPDGILVSDKKASPLIKDLVKGISQRPMFEERRWGWYRVLDHVRYEDGHEVLTKRIGILAGKSLSYQVHYQRSETWSIANGEGEFAFDDAIYKVKPGDVLRIPVGARHGIFASTDLELIEVQTGKQLIEEDIIRIFMTWQEVTRHCEQTRKETGS
ncbi:sugar phosphate nucleotidyltransferase [Desulfosporosinus sp. PR]|uniref:sugar phosphate nucleotidyltransferase n=1 Tax=Candidatus Desulfosporosinus nitrosoreducens TaxID=3401928 RepID=UPI0027FAE016|nr:sugar phosphate nucleotidyltransferase [Desulfosporosinus sp. PR]MDQ7095553.1 sugar phosphate nucleotidyltransferase [Desulfosporosinus sp. PR]